MLVIAHRGAKGLAPENTLESLRAGLSAGADMLEFDVRLTADKQAILCHDARIFGKPIITTTLSDLSKLGNITTLESVLDEFFGKILLNLEYKPARDIHVIYNLIAKKYIQNDKDWESIIISSFRIRPLYNLRKLSSNVNIALLHSINPFSFVIYHQKLRFAAVGWHRLHTSRLAIEMAKKLNIFSYVYTVNRPEAAKVLKDRGIDGIVTDFPDKFINGSSF